MLLSFRILFLRKRVRKAKSSTSHKYNKKEGGTTANFQISIFEFCFNFYIVGITEGVILGVGRVIFRVGRPDRGLLEASWRRNGRFVEAFWGVLRVSWGPGELHRTQAPHFGRPKSLQDAETS